MGQSLLDLVNANIETVRTGVLPMIFQKNKNFAVQRVTKNTESHRITKTTNGADFRAPIELGPAGKFSAANFEGGSLGLGTGFSIAQFLQTFFELKMGFQLSWQSIQGTATTDQTIFNAWANTMRSGLPNFAEYEDISWHNLGGQDGQIGVVTAVTGASPGVAGTFTFETDMGARLFLPNMSFEILSSDGNTWKTGQTGVSPDFLPIVSAGSVNYPSRQISYTCPVTLTGGNVPAAGDIIYLAGAIIAGSPPVPTWLQGVRYVDTTSTSGNYLGLSRTTYPVINSTAITTGGTLTPAMVLELAQTIELRAGDDVTQKLIGLVDPHQIAVMNSTVQAMQQYFRTTITQAQIDPLPNVQLDGAIVYGMQTHYRDMRQSASRIDYCNPEDWGRVYLNDKPGADFYKNPGNGEMFFPGYSANGAPSAFVLFYLASTLNYFNVNPQNSGLITSLSLPPGYSF